MKSNNLLPSEIFSSFGITGTPVITPLQGGQDMAMWKVELAGQVYTLRVFRSGEHATCERERCALEAVHRGGLPVPEVKAMNTYQEHPTLLLSWLEGHTVADELQMHPWRLWRLGRASGRMLAALHTVLPPSPLLQQPDAWIYWKSEGEQTEQEHLHLIADHQESMLHLDYHPRNILTDGKQITGIIDWTNAHAGDPRADLARTITILRLDPNARQSLPSRLILWLFALVLRNSYQHQRGPLKDMPFFYSWAGSVMLHDLAHRYQHEPHKLELARRWTRKWKR